MKIKPPSKKELLLSWLEMVKTVKTSQVIAWGVANGSNRAERNARDFAVAGKIRRMTTEEQYAMFGKIGEEVWTTEGCNETR
jgi:hypothetical protein